MRGYGLCYDTGFVHNGISTHEPFDGDRVRREMRVIAEDLHATAVRITGGIAERLKLAATHAAEAGLEVWICPFVCDVPEADLLALLADVAAHGEVLRAAGATVVLVTGSELSLFVDGLLPGDTFLHRARSLGARDPELLRAMGALPGRLNDLLAAAVRTVRAHFHGPVSYASLSFEGVDWTPFDILGTDAGYRSAEMGEQFTVSIREFVANAAAMGKPAVITEFGCVTYTGAAAAGARGGDVVTWDKETGRPRSLPDDLVRDEQEQAGYLDELLTIFQQQGVELAFVHAFANYHLPRSENPRTDFDRASSSIVAVYTDRHGETYPDMPWEPKRAFDMLAARH